MKKFIRILSILIFTLTLFVVGSINTYADDASDSKYGLYVSTDNFGGNGHAYASSGTLYFTFKRSYLTEGLTNNKNWSFTINYTTQDVTAISKAGDYESSSGTITLNNKNPNAVIAINVGTCKFGVKNKDGYGSTTRTFDLKITSFEVVVDGVKKTNTQITAFSTKMGNYSNTSETPVSSANPYIITCDMNYRFFHEYKTNDSGKKWFADYDNVVSKEESMWAKDNTKSTVKMFFGDSILQYWLDSYVNAGLADIYGGLEAWDVYESAPSPGDLWIQLWNKNTGEMAQIHYDYSKLSNESCRFSDQTSSEDGREVWYRDFNNTGYKEGSTFRGARLTNCANDTNSSGCYQIEVVLDNDDGVFSWYDRTCTVKVTERLVDRIKPKAQSIYGLSNTNDSKVKVAVRFNEPVYVKGTDPVYAKIRIGTADVPFKYVSGSDTDTLIFETDRTDFPASVGNIYLMGIYEDASFTNLTNRIYDFSSLGNSIDNSTAPLSGTTEFDFSTPSIKTVSTAKPTDAQSSRQYRVELENAKSGTLYYLFKKNTSGSLATIEDENLSEADYIAQYQGSIPVTSYTNVYTINAFDNDNNPLDGEYYLYLYLVAGNGKTDKKIDTSSGIYKPTDSFSSATTYKFDSTAPSLTDYSIKSDKNNASKRKIISFTVTDDNTNHYSGGIKSVEIEGIKDGTRYSNGVWSTNTKNIYSQNISFDIALAGTYKEKGTYETDDTKDVTRVDDIDLAADSYGYYDFEIIVTDFCGNTFSYEIRNVYFDNRDIFEVESTVTNATLIEKTVQDEELYKLGTSTNINVVCKEDTSAPISIYYMKFGNTVVVEEGKVKNSSLYNSLTGITSSVNDPTASATSIDIKPTTSGLLEVVFDKSGTKSKTLSYYLTANYEDNTKNYSTITETEYVKNYLFTLPKKYYYLSGTTAQNSTIAKEDLSYTSNDGLYPVFSSESKALEYVMYYEYQDMAVIYLDKTMSNIIKYLDGRESSTKYAKSRYETESPAIGQYWVRYKETTWDYGSNESSWVYYYLSDTSDKIDINNLPTPLRNAIDAVSSRIVSYGYYKYFVGPDFVDAYGYPEIQDCQIITADRNSVSATMTGTKFKANLYLEKDSNIYDSQNVDGINYLMHYQLINTGKTRLFIYRGIDAATNKKIYAEINLKNVTSLDDLSIFSNNIASEYTLLELDENGAREFKVYVDKAAPTITVKYTNKNVTSPNWSRADNNSTIYCKDFNFVSFIDDDSYAYVHVYGITDASVDITCLKSEFSPDKFDLSDGEYVLYVSDRYGNSFSVTVKIKSTEILVEASVVDNSYFMIDVDNRTSSEISVYEVYLNGGLITSKFVETFTITDSGKYYYLIEDMYGHIAETPYNTVEKDKIIVFERTLPKVEWIYKHNNTYISYDKDASPENYPFRFEAKSDSTYYVTTSVKLSCTFSINCDYRFIGTAPSYTESTNGYNSKRIDINDDSDWTIEIFYKNDPKTKVVYTCVLDTDAPKISVGYKVNQYETADKAYFDSLLSTKNIGDVLEGTSTAFVVGTSGNAYVSNLETVSSNELKLSISDTNTIKEIVITLNGEVIKKHTFISGDDSTNINEFTYTFTHNGIYEIKATDIFDNTSNLKFTNVATLSSNRTIDDRAEASTGLVYGNTSDCLTVNSTGTLVYKLTVDGVSKVYILRIKDSGVYSAAYKVVNDGTEASPVKTWGLILGDALFVRNDVLYSLDAWYNTKCDLITFKATTEGYVFKVLNGSTSIDVEYTYIPNNGYDLLTFISKLSKEVSNATLVNKTDSTLINTNTTGSIILAHDEFSIDYESLPSIITGIRIAYSLTSVDEDEREYAEVNLSNKERINTTADGFYYIEITNIYGNKVLYKISKYIGINVEYSVTYLTDESNTYSANYDDMICSNKEVKITLYDNNPYTQFKVEKLVDNAYVTQTPTIVSGSNTYSVTISEVGYYKVTVEDYFGNKRIKDVEIKVIDLEYNDSLITGFNQAALLPYYTNQVLSIDKEALINLGIRYVKVDKEVVYNTISETNKVEDDNKLVNCIGAENTRKVYRVYFYDKYGNCTYKDINYSSYSTLTVSRNFKTSLAFETAELTGTIASNNTIKLTTESSNYMFTVDGVEASLNMEYSYSNNGNYITHEIHYQDEYGFVHNFTVNIIRTDLTIKANTTYAQETINNVLTIGGPFRINYNSGAKCTYSYNNEGSYEYSGEELHSSGLYLFTVVDNAGNKTSLRVSLDTICEYKFIEFSTSDELFSKEVSAGVVEFQAINNDQVTIKEILKDGKAYELTGNRFSEHGFYHVVLVDAIGNKSEFEFYIITHKMKEFNYTVPTGYIVAEMYVELSQGQQDKFDGFDTTGFIVEDDGIYTVVLKNLETGVTDNFSFTISSIPPQATIETKLDEKGITKNDVVITGLAEGDVVEIYKGNSLYSTVTVKGSETITIKDAGKYRVVVTNEAGLTKELTFKKAFVMNTAGSVLVITLLVASSTMLLVGLMLRRRSKVDK